MSNPTVVIVMFPLFAIIFKLTLEACVAAAVAAAAKHAQKARIRVPLPTRLPNVRAKEHHTSVRT